MRLGLLTTTAALAVLAGCSGSDPAGPAAGCVAAVQVNGLRYVLDSSAPEASSISQAVFAEVTSSIGCDDTIESPGDGFEGIDEDNESNFLPVGATLHAMEGRRTSEALAVTWEGEWRTLLQRDLPT